MATPSISYSWRNPKASRGFRTGVSLHSHTHFSKEPLAFLAKFSLQFPVVRPVMERIERWVLQNFGVPCNYAAAYWTPPLTPKLAYDLEREQIEAIGLHSLVSITDHDTLAAPIQLRGVLGLRQVPLSFEWSVPYGEQSFHIGVHNLSEARATEWMHTLVAYTAAPEPARLGELLAALKAEPEVLVVFNHPMWDLYLIGRERHRYLLSEFLLRYGAHFHALELNALRNWEENRATRRLAGECSLGLISGGDRHGSEPNAAINLTNAGCFAEFAEEVRQGRSEILFMPQYAEPWKWRMLQSTIDAVRNFPQLPLGSRDWDQRFFHPDAAGVVRPFRELWTAGHPPLMLRTIIRGSQQLRRRLVSGGLRFVWSDSHQLHATLGEREG